MIINKKNNRKKYIVIGAIVGVLLISASAYAFIQSNSADTKTSAPTKEESEAGNAVKLDTLEQGTSSDEETTSTSDSSKNESPETSTATPAIRFTAKNQNGSLYQIRTMIDVVETGGTCVLTLTSGGRTVTKETQTQPLAQATTCQGFDVPVSELSAGTWNIKVSYKNNNSTAEVSDVIKVQ